MPSGFDELEDKVRKLLKSTFQRGSFNLHLQLDNKATSHPYQVNTDFLNELMAVANTYVEAGQAHAPRIDGMLSLRGVIDQAEKSQDDATDKDLEAAVLKSAEDLLQGLSSVRKEEGAQLFPVLVAQLAEIDQLVTRAIELAAGWPDKIRLKLKTQIERVLADAGSVDEARLEQELAILVTKADISEELDRLAGHVAATRELLENDAESGKGRRLDFICQEFNRETNTLCSKSNEKELTQIGLDLKVIIDRMREQVQNIE
jgi:uncharacterized protein (TIGR00255 family)